MITTLITATILARVLAGGPQTPVAHPCQEADKGWEQLLSEAAPPDDSWRWFMEGIRAALAAACEARRAGSALASQTDLVGSALAPQADLAGSGDLAGSVTVPQADLDGSGSGSQTDRVGSGPAPQTGQTGPELTPQIDRTGPGGDLQADGGEHEGDPQIAGAERGIAPRTDQAGFGSAAEDVHVGAARSGTDEGRRAGVDGSSGSEPPTRVRPPAVVPSAKPRVPQPSGPGASESSSSPAPPSPEPAEQSQPPSQLKPAEQLQRPSQLKPAEQSQASSPLTPAKQAQRPAHGQVAAVAALRQVGSPYVWGGGSSAGPTGGGFDCSGLALHAWSKAGATLSHYTGSQFRQGRRVPFSQLRPGDLVFFGGGTGDPTHVGVYVKDGVMVHAPKRGDVVKTTNFADSVYYRHLYRGAVRPAPR